jgi:hypothetical protein
MDTTTHHFRSEPITPRKPFICHICNIIPRAHSFQLIQVDEDGTNIYYTKPSAAVMYNNKRGILAHYDDTLNDKPEDAQWIWVFDAKDIEMKHLSEWSIAYGIAEIAEKHNVTLKKIIIQNENWMLRALITSISYVLASDLFYKIEYQ